MTEEICPVCKGKVEVRNPTGLCDHLYYPDNVKPNELLRIIKSLEAKNAQLKETIAELERWQTRNLQTKREWGNQLTEAEKTIKELQGRIDEAKKLVDKLRWNEQIMIANWLESALGGEK